MHSNSNQAAVKQVYEVSAEAMDMIIENNRLIKTIEKQITGEKWMTVEEAAKYIKKSVGHLRNRLKDQIGYSQEGREITFRVEDLDRFKMRHYHPAKD